jgi:hypothetical protein
MQERPLRVCTIARQFPGIQSVRVPAATVHERQTLLLMSDTLENQKTKKRTYMKDRKNNYPSFLVGSNTGGGLKTARTRYSIVS